MVQNVQSEASSHITFTVPSGSSRASPSTIDQKEGRRNLNWNSELMPHESEETPENMKENDSIRPHAHFSNTVIDASPKLIATGDFGNALQESQDYRIALHMLIIDGLDVQKLVTSVMTSS